MKRIDTSSFSEEAALQVTADTLERLLKQGINTLTLTSDDNEIIKVRVWSEGFVNETELEDAVEKAEKEIVS